MNKLKSISIDEKVIEVKENDAFIEINKKYNNDTTDKILLNLVRMLNELKEQYPKNIQINERWVNNEIFKIKYPAFCS